ncbi:hypothetical protein C8Q74DRAFT_1373787 [Fomes fomentarius]|nr:hypothetical protein C8Q74DRAFT_1373787 [Fomes fomentarius]
MEHPELLNIVTGAAADRGTIRPHLSLKLGVAEYSQHPADQLSYDKEPHRTPRVALPREFPVAGVRPSPIEQPSDGLYNRSRETACVARPEHRKPSGSSGPPALAATELLTILEPDTFDISKHPSQS